MCIYFSLRLTCFLGRLMTMISSLMEKLAEMESILRERFEQGGYKSEIITGSVSPDHVPKVSSEEQDRISSLLEEKDRITKNIWAITQTPVEEDLDLLLMEGNYYYDIQNFRKAREKFEKVLRIDPENVKALINLGVTLEVLDEWEKALKHFQRALKIFGELGDKSGVSLCLNNMGAIFYDQGDYGDALEHYQRALKIFGELGDKSGISECFINTGLCYEELGDQKRANELYEEGAKLCEKMGLHDQAKEYRSWIE